MESVPAVPEVATKVWVDGAHAPVRVEALRSDVQQLVTEARKVGTPFVTFNLLSASYGSTGEKTSIDVDRIVGLTSRKLPTADEIAAAKALHVAKVAQWIGTAAAVEEAV